MGKAFHSAAANGDIIGGGGHMMAGGLSFTDEQRPVLHRRLAEAFGLDKGNLEGDLAPVVEVGASASEFAPDQWALIFKELAPFGNGNPCPPLIVEVAELLEVRPCFRARFVPLYWSDEEDDPEEPFVMKPRKNPAHGGVVEHFTNATVGVFQDEIAQAAMLMTRLKMGNDPVSKYLADRLDAEARRPGGSSTKRPPPRKPQCPSPFSDASTRPGAAGLASARSVQRHPTPTANPVPVASTMKQNVFAGTESVVMQDAFPSEIRQPGWQNRRAPGPTKGTFRIKSPISCSTPSGSNIEQAEMLWQVHRFGNSDTKSARAVSAVNLLSTPVGQRPPARNFKVVSR